MNVKFNDIHKYRDLTNIVNTITRIRQINKRYTKEDQLIKSSGLYTSRLHFNINYIYLINDVFNYRPSCNNKTSDLTDSKKLDRSILPSNSCAQNTLFFKNANQITIPKKVLYVIQKYVSHPLLREIYYDIDVAREFCLLFLMQLNSGYFYTEDPNEEGWKSLNAGYLREFFSTNPLSYKKITETLLTPTSRGTLIECDGIYKKKSKNFFYRLGPNYIGRGFSNYTIETKPAAQLLQKYHQKKWDNVQQNVICKNLIQFYKSVTLPSIAEIEMEANRLIGTKYIKKGKRLKRLNKHPRSYFKVPDKYFFVEDAILIFNSLTENGIMIPVAGSDSSGGRVADSFTLMPSWIRKLVKVNGKPMIECDYSCLHPNIAVSLYGGFIQNLTHKHIENVLGLDKDLVKLEHLSFFNKDVWQMKESPLYDYYEKHEKWMLNNIIGEKRNDNEYKYKITSRRLFKIEVELMTQVITILNNENIFVGYVYDALFFDPIYGQRVKEVMDVVAIQMRVFTTGKLT